MGSFGRQITVDSGTSESFQSLECGLSSIPRCRMFAAQAIILACLRALDNEGNKSAIKIAMILMTTSTSIE